MDYKHTHYRTPRNLNQAWGPYSSFVPKRKKESVWWYLLAAGCMVAVVLMLFWKV